MECWYIIPLTPLVGIGMVWIGIRLNRAVRNVWRDTL